jgi:hypothetical protein
MGSFGMATAEQQMAATLLQLSLIYIIDAIEWN